MNHYETIVIFDPDLSEEDLESQAEALKDIRRFAEKIMPKV